MKLFPDIKPFKQHFIKVDSIHTLYVEEVGNPKGIPIIFLHGGPGAGLSKIYKRFFNPKIYHIVLFDQRGSGKSIPYGCVKNNTTNLLIDDIKKITKKLDIQKFILYGGSWGSTLALLYAQKFPETIYSLVLRGIFLCRKKDIDWFYQFGASEIFPDEWQKFTSLLSDSEKKNILNAFYKKIHKSTKKHSNDFCLKWSNWEGACSTVEKSKTVRKSFKDCSISLARIETHYFKNNCFIKENQIIRNIDIIKNIKCYIVHGKYDMVCPLNQAYDLKRVYKKANLYIIDNAGHSLLEKDIATKITKIFSNPKNLT
ncbi:MAG: prolyl aminopeptidase [Gammaproteobacteria bacterium]|nr:prolyl aminopeptidase [Gammaproteobacteria bacterium]|tara:strand:- start:6834 stop:7772 length:939 start_codon:yes stop_codon:yes gene_type:complete